MKLGFATAFSEGMFDEAGTICLNKKSISNKQCYPGN